MNYRKFQKFSHAISILFNVLFWIILIGGIITSIGFVYIIANYNNLPKMIEELKIITAEEAQEILKFSKGYLIMCLVDFVVLTGLDAWLYKTISNSAKSFENSDTVFTKTNMNNIKQLSKIFYIMAGASFLIISLAGATLNDVEASLFVFDETSLILGFVFTFIVFLFKQTAKPVITTIQITQEVNSDQTNQNSLPKDEGVKKPRNKKDINEK